VVVVKVPLAELSKEPSDEHVIREMDAGKASVVFAFLFQTKLIF
jgi:hypothetical protein